MRIKRQLNLATSAKDLKTRATAAVNMLTDFILPPVCLSCHDPLESGNKLCPTCWQGITFISAPYCQKTGHPLPYDAGPEAQSTLALKQPPIYDKARAVALYEGTMRRLIHKLKYQDKHELTTLLASMMITSGSELIRESDLLIPIPLHRWRFWQRRFNQSTLLAAKLAELTGLPLDHTSLIRHKKTRQQVGLTEQQRKRNMQGAFQLKPAAQPRLEGKNILLIDDVMTTGATANAAAALLKQAGCNSVMLLSIATVLKV